MRIKQTTPIGIYIHIPFCIRKCRYCDFLSFPVGISVQSDYVNKLCKQIEATQIRAAQTEEAQTDASHEDCEVASVYFGGGTPSVLPSDAIAKIMETVRMNFKGREDAEITIEVNPGTTDQEKFASYRRAGINRVSIGLQSADERELKLLGRIHSAHDFHLCFRQARAAGFENISCDIMTVLPEQNATVLAETLSVLLALRPEHISAYSLILEEGTPFYEQFHKEGQEGSSILPEEAERALYNQVRDTLVGAGYRQYEISNFALEGFESRHNSAYWTRQDYYGFGLGASSLVRGERRRNVADLNAYLADPCAVCERTVLSKQDAMEEFMFLGLRRLCGISDAEFEDKFRLPIEAVYGSVLDRLGTEGLLERRCGRTALSTKGIDYGNYVFASFLL